MSAHTNNYTLSALNNFAKRRNFTAVVLLAVNTAAVVPPLCIICSLYLLVKMTEHIVD